MYSDTKCNSRHAKEFDCKMKGKNMDDADANQQPSWDLYLQK
jgi:hypothetical protein